MSFLRAKLREMADACVCEEGVWFRGSLADSEVTELLVAGEVGLLMFVVLYVELLFGNIL